MKMQKKESLLHQINNQFYQSQKCVDNFTSTSKQLTPVQSTSGNSRNSATPSSLSKSEIDSLKEKLQEKQECDALRFTNEIILQHVKNVSRISSRSWQRLKDEIIFFKKKIGEIRNQYNKKIEIINKEHQKQLEAATGESKCASLIVQLQQDLDSARQHIHRLEHELRDSRLKVVRLGTNLQRLSSQHNRSAEVSTSHHEKKEEEKKRKVDN